MVRGASLSNSTRATLSELILSTTIEERTVADYTASRRPNRRPTHPGELVCEEVIPATGKTKPAAA